MYMQEWDVGMQVGLLVNLNSKNGMIMEKGCWEYVINLTTNSFFKHKEIHKFIGHKTKKNFYYIITKQVNTFNMYNIRVCREADCGSDHRLLKMELSWPWIKQMTANIKQNQPPNR
jgi:hypothetical protein